MAVEEMAKGLHDAQQALLHDLWHEQQAHCERIRAEWDDVWEQTVHAVLPSWTVASRRARSVLETVCRLYAQALRGSHTLAHDTLTVRRDGIVALMHDLRELLGTEARERALPAPIIITPAVPAALFHRVLDEHASLRDCTARVDGDSNSLVRVFDASGAEVFFVPPCDVYATDQPANILYSLGDFDAHGVREHLLVAAYAEMHIKAHTTMAMTTVWCIAKAFGVGATAEHSPHNVTTVLLLDVQRIVLRRVFLSSPPAHAACLLHTLKSAQCLLMADDRRSVHEAVARVAQPPPMLWLPIPECYTAFVVDVILDELLRTGRAPDALSHRTMPCTAVAPPTQAWPIWLRYYVSPPSSADFVRGWPEETVQRLRRSGGHCDTAFRRALAVLIPITDAPHQA
jgi:hypothetical protein